MALCTLLPTALRAQPSTGAEDVNAYQGGTWSLACDVSDLFALDTSVDGVEGLLTTIDADTGNIATSAADINLDTFHIPTISGAVTSLDGKFGSAVAAADDTVNPNIAKYGAYGFYYDGVTWDRVRGTSADGALVNLGSNNDVTVTSLVSPTMPTAATTAQTALLNNTSTTVLAANASRKIAFVTNPTSGVTLWCAENAVAVVGQGAPIFYGGAYTVLSDDAVTCIQNSGSSQNANTVTAQ